jgi:hypothetical protein
VEYFTVRNTVILALTQVGVLTAGVLAAGACHKWHTTFNLRPPASTTLLADYGYLALLVPLVWVALALRALRRHADAEVEARRRTWAFLGGVALLLLLLIVVGKAAVLPLFRLMGV